MATDTRPPLYQAITKSYRIRNIMHAAKGGKEEKTLCGRPIASRSRNHFEEDGEGACGKCKQSIAVMNRAHPGWE